MKYKVSLRSLLSARLCHSQSSAVSTSLTQIFFLSLSRSCVEVVMDCLFLIFFCVCRATQTQSWRWRWIRWRNWTKALWRASGACGTTLEYRSATIGAGSTSCPTPPNSECYVTLSCKQMLFLDVCLRIVLHL